jgi:hypothetical protein
MYKFFIRTLTRPLLVLACVIVNWMFEESETENKKIKKIMEDP